MKKNIMLLFVAVLTAAGVSQATLLIGSLDSATVIDFSTTIADTWYGGGTINNISGFQPTPTSSYRFDSDTWAAYAGSSNNVIRAADGAGASGYVGWGGTVTSGNIARGMNVTAGGTAGLMIASNAVSGYMMAFRPYGTGTDNSTIWLRIQNNTGNAVTSWTFDYDAFFIDIGTYNTAFTFAFSTDDSTYTDVASLSGTTSDPGAVATPTVADWTAIALNAATVNATVADGGYLYLRLKLGGDIPVNLNYGDRIGIDNISITANSVIPEPATIGMIGVGALAASAIRRYRRIS